MAIPASRRGLQRRFESAPQKVKEHLKDLPALLLELPLEVALAYVFARVELAHNNALYCGVVKIHKANREIARSAVDAHHMTRQEFHARFETVFGRALPEAVLQRLETAEGVRDKVMHGKRTLEREKREAIGSVISYAEGFNEFVGGLAGFRPFGDLRGFKGRGKSLPKATTRWVLKGMGFDLS